VTNSGKKSHCGTSLAGTWVDGSKRSEAVAPKNSVEPVPGNVGATPVLIYFVAWFARPVSVQIRPFVEIRS
jgi:hypothetical protein